MDRLAMNQRNWMWLLMLGIVFVILGFVGLGMTVSLTIVSMFFFGVLLVIGGISQLIDGMQAPGWKGLFGHMIIGLLYLFCSIIIFRDPLLISTFLTMILGCLLVAMGIIRFGMALSLKGTSGWGWLLVAGLSAFVLGVLILLQWPLSGLWIIGLFIAIELMIAGWTYIFMAMCMRKG